MSHRRILPIGVTYHDFRETIVGLPIDWMTQHTILAGSTGSGKSTVMINMGIPWAELGRALIFFDPKGDECRSLIKRLPFNQRHRVLHLDVKNTTLTLNVLDMQGRVFEDPYHLTSNLSRLIDEVSRKRGTPQSPRQYRFLNMALNAVLRGVPILEKLAPCLTDVKRFLVEKSYREELLQVLESSFPDDTFLSHTCYEMKGIDRDVSFEALLHKLHPLVEDPVLSRLFAGRETTLDLQRIVCDPEGAIVCVELSDLPVDILQLVGSLLLSYFFNASLLRPRSKRHPILYILDEFHMYAGDIAREITRVRSYNLALVFAHQSDATIPSQVMKVILDNVAFTISMRCGGNYAALLARQYGGLIEPSDLVMLPNYVAWVKTPTRIFSCQTLPLPEEPKGRGPIPLPPPPPSDSAMTLEADDTDAKKEAPVSFSLAIEHGNTFYEWEDVL